MNPGAGEPSGGCSLFTSAFTTAGSLFPCARSERKDDATPVRPRRRRVASRRAARNRRDRSIGSHTTLTRGSLLPFAELAISSSLGPHSRRPRREPALWPNNARQLEYFQEGCSALLIFISAFAGDRCAGIQRLPACRECRAACRSTNPLAIESIDPLPPLAAYRVVVSKMEKGKREKSTEIKCRGRELSRRSKSPRLISKEAK